jgi:hypothetical protein
MSTKQNNWIETGRLRATIIDTLAPVTGTNEATGEVYTYVPVVCTAPTVDGPMYENIFINEFNKAESIVKGANIDIVFSRNTVSGKNNSTTFMASKYASIAAKMTAAGCSTEVIAEAKQSAADRIRAKRDARKNATN